MSESEVIVIMRHHLEGKFPKQCPVCSRTYGNLRDYLEHTQHLGAPTSYDAEVGDFQPLQPIGTQSLANCACGNTLAIDSSGMRLGTLWRLMRWLMGEMFRRQLTASAVLTDLRSAIDRATLADEPL